MDRSVRVTWEGIEGTQAELGLMVDLVGSLRRRLLERAVPGSEFTGWIDLPLEAAQALDSLLALAEEVRRRGDLLLVIGIGGSFLGARAAYEALGSPSRLPRLCWAGWSLSPTMTRRVLEELDGCEFMVNVISKSGGTMEPAVAFRLVAEVARHRWGSRWTDRVIVTTDPHGGALRRWATEAGIRTLEIPPSVGGRFSVLSPVGVFPLAVAGIDVRAMVEGAVVQRQVLHGAPAEEDPSVLYASARCLLEQRGRCVEVLALPGPELWCFGEWWRQLAGESEGKTGAGIWPSLLTLTADLHSVGQYLQEGRRILQETFLAFDAHEEEPLIPASGPVADGLDRAGRVSLGLLNRLALEGTREAHRAGGVPGVTVNAARLEEYCLGQLFYFFEVAVALTALFHAANPFDQPGVEAYKRRVAARLEALR